MKTIRFDSAAGVNRFDEHHEIIQLVNDDRSAGELLNVFFARQCSNPRQASHWIANVTFVSGPLEATILGIDARGLNQLARAMTGLATKFDEERQA